jgi:predicted Zn-dependent protease
MGMHRNTVLFVIIAALSGFIAGFLLANAINRSESAIVRKSSSAALTTNGNAANGQDQDLTAEEIQAKITEADQNPNNFDFQKALGSGLYRYAAMKQDSRLLGESARILERANSLKNGDFDVLVTLGNATFDIAYSNKDNKGFVAARELYTKALEIKPGDPDVSTDRALTYFFFSPADYDTATAELQKVADANPKHERSLQFLVQAYIKQNKLAEADKALTRLKSVNSQNHSISELQSQLSEARAGIK